MAVVALTALAAATGCGTTVEDDTAVDDTSSGAVEEPAPEGSGRSGDDAPAPGTAMAGSTADVLALIGDELRGLSAEIGGGGDDDAVIERIEAGWATIRDDIGDTRPELLDRIQATIDMARLAVDRRRPADADKAYGLLTDLIDAVADG